MRYSLNSVRNSLEVGSTSNWVVSFEKASQISPNVDSLNLIKDGGISFSPVLDISLDESIIKNKDFNIGPGLEFRIPIYAQSGTKVSVTFYDDHFKKIRNFLLDWVQKSLKLESGKSPNLRKEIALILNLFKFDKALNLLSNNMSYYVIPDETINFRGDQSFSPDTFPFVFNIIGIH